MKLENPNIKYRKTIYGPPIRKPNDPKPTISVLITPEFSLMQDYVFLKYNEKRILTLTNNHSDPEYKVRARSIANEDILLLLFVRNYKTEKLEKLFKGETKFKWKEIIVIDSTPTNQWKSNFNILINHVDNYVFSLDYNQCTICKGQFDHNIFLQSFRNSSWKNELMNEVKNQETKNKILFFDHNNKLTNSINLT
ncbi:7147_t:CDS:1 [Gigaspora margarita]|uniref:7147_t:CDS:1 n=1 Tax=Gigaspora margarita TaxID=4874 RepID=A0ABN7UY28_GIGMA|nr:7147_t:CDS:1 [Gigaspora margarita]